MTKHAPWRMEISSNRFYVKDKENFLVAVVGSELRRDSENLARARVITAAPDMLAALKRLYADWDGEPEDIAEAREAIRKAEGGDAE